MIIRPDDLINSLRGEFIARNDVLQSYGNAISTFQTLPGLVGFWPMSSVQRSTGNAYDLSGQARTLTYNGNPTYNIYNNFVPYIDLDGTGDYLSRADETDLDILGTESWAANPGLTMIAWININAFVGSSEGYFTKWATGATSDISYALWEPSTNNVFMFSVGNGASQFNVGAGVTNSTGQWYYVAGRFTPSTEIKIWRNQTTNIKTTSIPASILNGSAPLSIGAIGAGNFLSNAKISLCALCASALPDALINLLFQQTRGLFGV